MIRKIDKPLLIVSLILFIFGLIMVLSASSMESYMRYDASPYHYFIRQAIFMGSGFIIFVFVLLIPTDRYKKISGLLMLIISLLLFGLTVWGYSANQAQSWFQIGPFSLQPSEFAKVIVILFLAMYYDKHNHELNNLWIIIKPIIFCFILVAMVAIQPDLGTAGIIGLMSLIIFYALPMGKKNRVVFNKFFFAIVLVIISLYLSHGLKKLNLSN